MDERIADVEWLARAGDEGWPVLMKDERIRYRPAERTAVSAHGVQAFYLTSGNLVAAAMAHQYIAVIDELATVCRESGPFLYAVSGAGLRRIDLTS